MIPKLLTPEQTAEIFPGKNVRWVMDYLVRGKRVDVVRIKGSRFITETSVKALLEANMVHGLRRAR